MTTHVSNSGHGLIDVFSCPLQLLDYQALNNIQILYNNFQVHKHNIPVTYLKGLNGK